MKLVKKTKEQKEYLLRLKSNISSFLVNYKKRYQLFPWSLVNKISKMKIITDTPITVHGTEFTVKELIKEINKYKGKIQSRIKPSYFNFILKAYIKDSMNKTGNELSKVYRQYNEQLNLQFKEMKDDLFFCLDALKELNKVVKNEKKKQPVSESVELIEEGTHTTGIIHKLYHVSKENLNGKVLHPRIPENKLTKNNLEEALTPRVCFAPTIDRCLMALSQNLENQILYVHVPVDKTKYSDVSKHQVADAKVTKEKWVTYDVELKCIGKIKVLSAKDKKYKFDFRDVNKEEVKKAEMNPINWTYKWNWEWVEKYVNESTNLDDSKQKILDDLKHYVKWASMDDSCWNNVKPLNDFIIHKSKKSGDLLLLAKLYSGGKDTNKKILENLSNNVCYDGNNVEFKACYLPGDLFIYIELKDIPINESTRSELKDSQFGIPEDRKFPLDTKEHVKSAIKLFGHAEESKKKELANRIKRAADKYDIEIPESTQCYKYLHESSNDTIIMTESTQKSVMDKSFKKKTGGNFEFLDLHDVRAKEYLFKNSYFNKYFKSTYSYTNGEIAVDKDKNKLAGYIYVGGGNKSTNRNYGFIQTLEVLKPYRGYGLSTRLLKDAIKKYHAVDLTCYKDNEVAMNLYKKHGFVIIGYGNSKNKMDYWMKLKSKLTKDDKVMKESVSDSLFTENVILNKNDIYKNFDKFESGKSNVLLITGFSGSGKSSLGKNLASKYNAEHYELDVLSFFFGGNITNEEIKKSEPGLMEFLNKHKEYENGKVPSNKEIMEAYKKYIPFLISWCKRQKDKKFIIEGLQLYEIFDKEHPQSYFSNPIIIKGTSGLKSAIQAAKRNNSDNENTSFMKELNPLIKWALKDNKNLEALSKYVKEAVNKTDYDDREKVLYKTIQILKDNGRKPNVSKTEEKNWLNCDFDKNDFGDSLCIAGLGNEELSSICNKVNAVIKPYGGKLSPDNYGTAFLTVHESEENSTMDRITFIDEHYKVVDLNDYVLECMNDVDDFLFDDDDTFTEGANIDMTKAVKKYVGEIKKSGKLYKNAIKSNNFSDARKAISSIRSNIDDAIKTVNSIPSDTSSAVLGTIARAIIMMAKVLIPSFGIGVVGGVAGGTIKKLSLHAITQITAFNIIRSVVGISSSIISVITSLKEIIGQLTEIINKIKNSKEVTADTFNAYKNGIIVDLKKFKENTKKMETTVNEMEKKYKELQKEASKKEKSVKESAEFVANRKAIYEACANGEITLDEREELLHDLNREYMVKESEEPTTNCANSKERFEAVRKAIYEKCSNGEITLDEREILLEKAKELLLEKSDVTENTDNTEPTVDSDQQAEEKNKPDDSSSEESRGVKDLKNATEDFKSMTK